MAGHTDTYAGDYFIAQQTTTSAVGQGPVRHAAALAQQIRWNAEKRRALNYPPGMPLATTCCCHICVDDPNFKTSHVESCLTQAREQGHPDCIQLAELLLGMSQTQRRKVNRLAWS